MTSEEIENGKIEVEREKSEKRVAVFVWLRNECVELRDIVCLWKEKVDKQIEVLEDVIEEEGGKL